MTDSEALRSASLRTRSMLVFAAAVDLNFEYSASSMPAMQTISEQVRRSFFMTGDRY